MNTDIRLSTGFFQHPKTVKLQRRLGLEGVVALQRLWIWAAQNRSDGSLSGLDAEDIAIAAGWEGEGDAFVDALLAVRFLDETENGRVLHGWAEHQSYVVEDKARIERARNAANARWGKANAKSDAEGAKSNAGDMQDYASSIASSMPEHADSNAGSCSSTFELMPPTQPNLTELKEKYTPPLPPSPGGGACSSPAPLSGEDIAEAKDAVRQEHRRGDYEFSLLRQAYDSARQEGPLAGRQEFLRLFGSPEWPGIDELVHAVDVLCAEDDQFRRGYAPGLARFLADRMWRMRPRAPAGEKAPTQEDEDGKRKWEALKAKVRADKEARKKRGR